MDKKELNELAFELAIKSLDNKKKENKGIIITLIICFSMVLFAFSIITYMNCKRIDRVVDVLEGSSVEDININYGNLFKKTDLVLSFLFYI